MRVLWLVVFALVGVLGAALLALGAVRQVAAEGCEAGAGARCEDAAEWRRVALFGGVLATGGAVGGLAAWRSGTKA